MQIRRLATSLLTSLLCLSGLSAQEPVAITTGSLVSEMVDMHRLAEFPSPAFKTVQFSSYDRRSSLPGGPGWFANADGFGGEPIPGFEAVIAPPGADGVGEYLICDVEGPGAIVRTWTAIIEGRIRLLLDGAEQPVFEGSARDFLARTYEALKPAGYDDAIFAGTFRQRDACYCPIPFATRCRMIWIGKLNQVHFYQVQIRLYDKGAKVSTFRAEDLNTYSAEIRRVAGILAAPDRAWPYRSKREPVAIRAELAPGQRTEALKLDGPAALEQLTLKLTAGNLDLGLRQTVLHVVCDDYPWGQVQSPVGDFFGAAPGVNPYDAVPFTVAPDGAMTCRYVMPFAKSLRIILENRGAQSVNVAGSALPADYAWNPDRSMHFRALWRADHEIVASNTAVQDIPYIVANGAGIYVGTALMLLNPSPIPTPGGCWWGEGDEKIFVDADVRPSTFGTGSEDYFNYSWSVPDIFVHPYCGQPRDDGPANRGFVTNDRWHIIDCLPFKERLSFYMELFSHERVPGVSYARIGYHYGRPGIMDDHVPLKDEDLRLPALPPNWQPAARGGAGNSVFFQAEDILAQGGPATELIHHDLWAGGRLMVWRPKARDEALTFTLPVKEAGKYVVHLTAAFTPDSGRVAVELDGRPAGFGGPVDVVDLAVPHRTLSRVVSSSVVDLAAGEHKLTLRYAGDPGRRVGIDFIWIQKR